MATTINVIFVHGWSVTNVDTYGALPIRLRAEAALSGMNIEIKEIFLGKYISFHDEVRVRDVSRAFRTAVAEQLGSILSNGGRFICITHSTGGPVIRDWWHRYYLNRGEVCPMTHLIMLAPANYGSALAQLGKGRIGRLKSWFDGVEPGQGVLDWLELGSSEAWALNREWIKRNNQPVDGLGVFPFVLTGECIDRKLYDNLNAYTGEIGSDGVVRVAAANLEGRYIKLQQPVPHKDPNDVLVTGDFEVIEFDEAPKTPLRVLTSKAHSGDTMGIMKSVKADVGEKKSSETISALLACIQVQSKEEYDVLYSQFVLDTTAVQLAERLEIEERLLLSDRPFIHDRFSMVIFRVFDTEGFGVKDFDLLITAGENSDPNHLPSGFFADRQRNRINGETITYYLNYDIMNGAAAVIGKNGETIRPALPGIDSLGLEIRPRPDNGFVRYLPCRIKATKDLFEKALVPNTTTMIEIVLQRIVVKEVFRLDPITDNKMPTKKQGNFKDVKPGNDIAG